MVGALVGAPLALAGGAAVPGFADAAARAPVAVAPVRTLHLETQKGKRSFSTKKNKGVNHKKEKTFVFGERRCVLVSRPQGESPLGRLVSSGGACVRALMSPAGAPFGRWQHSRPMRWPWGTCAKSSRPPGGRAYRVQRQQASFRKGVFVGNCVDFCIFTNRRQDARNSVGNSSSKEPI